MKYFLPFDILYPNGFLSHISSYQTLFYYILAIERIDADRNLRITLVVIHAYMFTTNKYY